MKNINLSQHNRRSFLFKALSSCTLCCLATSNVIGSDTDLTPQDEKHKFLSDSGMSEQDVYNFAFKQWYIPAMKNLMEQTGKEKFIKMLKESSDKLHEVKDVSNADYSKRTLQKWSTNIINGCENFSNKLTFEVLSNNDELFEIKFTECLWAKTFRDANAPEIGYAGVCYQDYGMSKAYHPKLKLTRNKTRMQGDDCCHFKWTMET